MMIIANKHYNIVMAPISIETIYSISVVALVLLFILCYINKEIPPLYTKLTMYLIPVMILTCYYAKNLLQKIG